MKLYIANGVYVGTQAEARKADKLFTQVEVPTDKDGLIAYLNAHQVDRDVHHQQVADGPFAQEPDDIADLLGEPEPEPVAPPPPPRPALTAGNIVSAIDTPGIEQMIEVIATSKGQSLRRFAGAVAVRFAELAK